MVPTRLMLLVLMAGVSAGVIAQESENKLSALQTKEALADADRAALREWIAQQVAGVAETDPAGAQAAFARLRDACTGTAAFKDAYVLTCLDVIGSAYKKAQVTPAARLMALLNVLNDPRSVSLLFEALQDDRAAVRAAAVVALTNLRPKLVADADASGRLLAALKDAAKKESSRETLQLIYRAMNFADVQPTPSLRPCAQALLEVLEERVKLLAGETVRAEGADVTALTSGAALYKSLDDADRKRYAVVLARMLQYAVSRYTGGEAPLGLVRDKTGSSDVVALRNATELMIRSAEQQLVEILALTGAPQVTETMLRSKKLEKAQLTDIVLEMNKWVPIAREKLGIELPPITPPPEETTTKPASKPKP